MLYTLLYNTVFEHRVSRAVPIKALQSVQEFLDAIMLVSLPHELPRSSPATCVQSVFSWLVAWLKSNQTDMRSTLCLTFAIVVVACSLKYTPRLHEVLNGLNSIIFVL